MRTLVCFFAAAMSLSAIADANVNPFDGDSCRGTMMSADRALELLGPNDHVNLATKDDTPADYIKVHYRFRNKVNGRKGPWYPSQLETNTAAPTVNNANGNLNFTMYVNPTTRDFKNIKCDIKNSFEMNCADSQNMLSNWGNGTFWGVITNNCVRLKSERSSVSRDEEWVYYMAIN
jgi:hypothetical protein